MPKTIPSIPVRTSRARSPSLTRCSMTISPYSSAIARVEFILSITACASGRRSQLFSTRIRSEVSTASCKAAHRSAISDGLGRSSICVLASKLGSLTKLGDDLGLGATRHVVPFLDAIQIDDAQNRAQRLIDAELFRLGLRLQNR